MYITTCTCACTYVQSGMHVHLHVQCMYTLIGTLHNHTLLYMPLFFLITDDLDERLDISKAIKGD